MTKVRVQDVTRELSANTGKMLENVTRMRKQSQEMLNSLRRISDGFAREERERQERGECHEKEIYMSFCHDSRGKGRILSEKLSNFGEQTLSQACSI